MARKPRLHIPGGFYHVMIRGNGGQDIFFDTDDRSHFYLLLQAGLSRYDHRIHGFCCMPNHVHLLIQVGGEPLSKIMQNLSFRYTRWVNKRQKRMGHLFQGRFKAILVDADSYMLELVRYIHLNPVRAGLVNKVDKYPWSSHVVYSGKDSLPWLTTDWVYGHFSRQRAACIRQYNNFIGDGVGEKYRKEFHVGNRGGQILGEDKFVEAVLNELDIRPVKLVSFEKIVKLVCEICEVDEKSLSTPSRERKLSEARGIIAWCVAKEKSATLTSVAQYFNRDLSAMSFAVRRIEGHKHKSLSLREKLRLLDKSIIQA